MNEEIKNDRVSIIKILQDQLIEKNLDSREKNVLESALKTSENTIIMIEKEYKSQLEELQYKNEDLAEENRMLRRKLIEQQESVIIKNADNMNDGIIEKLQMRAYKWKTKCKILDQNPEENSKKVFCLEKRILALEGELSASRNECLRQRDQKSEVLQELVTINGSYKEEQEKNKLLSLQIQSLNSEVIKFSEENSRLLNKIEQKTSLLKHMRKKYENTSQNSSDSINQITEPKTKMLMLEERVLTLKRELKLESTNNQKLTKRLETTQKDYESYKELSEQTISQLEKEKARGQKENISLTSDISNLQLEFKTLEIENIRLNKQLDKLKKMKEQILSLQILHEESQQTINRMGEENSSFKNTIDQMISDLSYLCSHYKDSNGYNDWKSCFHCVKQCFSEVEILHKEMKNLNGKIEQKRNTINTLTNQIHEVTKENLTLNSELSKVSPIQSTDASNVESSQYSNEPNPVHSFRRSLQKYTDQRFYSIMKSVIEMNNTFVDGEPSSNMMRSMSLCMIFVTRLSNIQRTGKFDPTSLLEYVPAMAKSKKSSVELLSTKVKDIKSKNSQLNTELESKTKTNKELQDSLNDLSKANSELKSELRKKAERIVELQTIIDRLNEEMSKMIHPSLYAQLEESLKDTKSQLIESNQELLVLKNEMSNMLDSINNVKIESESHQLSIQELTLHNESLTTANQNLILELENANCLIKEKNKEILSLERRLINHKSSIEIVKEKIDPLSNRITQKVVNLPNSTFSINETVRNDLSKIQSQLTKSSRF